MKIGFGGGCHWCTEAVYQSLEEVQKVDQGWIKSKAPHEQYSEAVVVHFDLDRISLKELIHIHLQTHSSTSKHSMRSKYRSAIYYFNEDQKDICLEILQQFQAGISNRIVTEVLPFDEFKLNQENYLNYYYKNPEKPFCQTYIKPKLEQLNNFRTVGGSREV